MAKQLRITVEGKTYDVTVETVGEVASVTKVAAAAAPVATAAPAIAAPVAPVAPVAPKPVVPSGGANDVKSPLAAVVVSFEVKVGQTVAVGDKVATIEAMKMNTLIYAEVAGTVTAILVQPGQSVQEGQSLVSIG